MTDGLDAPGEVEFATKDPSAPESQEDDNVTAANGVESNLAQDTQSDGGAECDSKEADVTEGPNGESEKPTPDRLSMSLDELIQSEVGSGNGSYKSSWTGADKTSWNGGGGGKTWSANTDNSWSSQKQSWGQGETGGGGGKTWNAKPDNSWSSQKQSWGQGENASSWGSSSQSNSWSTGDNSWSKPSSWTGHSHEESWHGSCKNKSAPSYLDDDRDRSPPSKVRQRATEYPREAPAAPREREPRQIIVAGIKGLKLSRGDLERAFSAVGAVEACVLGSATATITYAQARSARDAVHRFHGGHLDDKVIDVYLVGETAETRSRSPPRRSRR